MAKFEITAPNGQILEIEGDTPPSEAELDDIFASVGANTSQEQPQSNGIDLTPSGLVKQAMSVPAAALKTALQGGDFANNRQQALETYENFKPAGGLGDFAVDMAAYSRLPMLRGTSLAGKIGAFGGNVLTQGVIPGGLESLKRGEGFGSGAKQGGIIAGALNAIPGGASVIQKTLNSPQFKNISSKVSELLTSVPSEYYQRALEKELTGNSIFKGKFNTKDINEAYNQAGERAILGMKNAENVANEEIRNALENLPEGVINTPELITDITKGVDSFANGGRYNPAMEEKGKDILNYVQELNNPNNKTVDFHNIKDSIQTQLRSQYGKETGAGINALKGIGAKVRQALNNVSPEYAQANANREMLHDIKNTLGGMNEKTIASNLRNVETEAKLRSGYNQAAEELENLVAPKYKFLDDVKDLRAREALESWFPGQYGGSGSSQGAANLVRAGLAGSGATAGALLHNPLAFPAIAAMSPKLGAKGTIQNLGRINKTAEVFKNIPDRVKQILSLGTLTAPTLYGGISNEDLPY